MTESPMFLIQQRQVSRLQLAEARNPSITEVKDERYDRFPILASDVPTNSVFKFKHTLLVKYATYLPVYAVPSQAQRQRTQQN